MAKINKVSAFIAYTKAQEAGDNEKANEMKNILGDFIALEIQQDEPFKEYEMKRNEKKLFMI